jgi:hypothetical protein
MKVKTQRKKEVLQRKTFLLKKVLKKKIQNLSFNRNAKPAQAKIARRIIKDVPQWKQPKQETIEHGIKGHASEAMKVLIKVVRLNLN